MDPINLRAEKLTARKKEEKAMRQIVVADDSATVRMMLKFAMSGSGYRILEACDGLVALEALDRLEKSAVAMMITALSLPRLDGVELIRRVRSHPEHRCLPIIMMSETEDSRILDGQRAGASTLLVKPLNIQQIFMVMQMILGHECRENQRRQWA
jgi:two-component system, chemotaxis family, chemotaxis protein CheY